MLNPRSFSEIFNEIHSEESMTSTISDSAKSFTAGWETLLEPSNLAFLMGQVQVLTPNLPRTSKAYPPRPRPAHVFTPEQSGALDTLASFAPNLQNNFNLRDLRTAYRAAVLKTHPDQGGTAESFQSVKKSYHILWAFVNTEA
ncbi:MAG: hypothetical protein H7061_07350 [Bdellovibrionaceae bacterium]|nr:hypothetical protein [Bdellovibrio sp.]